MRIYQDLVIDGEPEAVQATLSGITDALRDGWVRDREIENNLSKHGPRYYCFTCTAAGQRRAACLSLVEKSHYHLTIANITPLGTRRKLSPKEYNDILRELAREFARPVAQANGVMVTATSDVLTVDNALPADVAAKLRRFSNSANKSSAAGHPVDRERWLAFIVAAHGTETPLSSGELRRLLMEELGWSEPVADALSADYASAREVLDYYDESR